MNSTKKAKKNAMYAVTVPLRVPGEAVPSIVIIIAVQKSNSSIILMNMEYITFPIFKFEAWFSFII